MCSQPDEFKVEPLPTRVTQVRCYKCNRKLADGISGSDYHLKFTCPKCKCSFAITPNGIQPISIWLDNTYSPVY